MFYQNHSLVLLSTENWDIFQFNLKKSLDLALENLELLYWVRINFIIYWTWTRTILDLSTLLDSDWFYDELELDLKRPQATLLDVDWFYDILDLNLKNTWTKTDSDSDWFYYN